MCKPVPVLAVANSSWQGDISTGTHPSDINFLCAQVLPFFETLGFKCPKRKGVADFLQEVTSRKDQAQYWCVRDLGPIISCIARPCEGLQHTVHDSQRMHITASRDAYW